MLALSTEDGLVGDVTNVQHVPAGDRCGEDERDASLAARMSFLASCLLAFAGEVRNAQHGLPVDTDWVARREGSPVAKASVLATFRGGRVIRSCSSD